MGREDVEANRVGFIPGIDNHDVIYSLRWNDTQNAFNQIAVRIEHSQTFAVLNVFTDEVEQQSRFPRTGGANNMGMTCPLFWCEIHMPNLAGMFIVTQVKPG